MANLAKEILKSIEETKFRRSHFISELMRLISYYQISIVYNYDCLYIGHIDSCINAIKILPGKEIKGTTISELSISNLCNKETINFYCDLIKLLNENYAFLEYVEYDDNISIDINMMDEKPKHDDIDLDDVLDGFKSHRLIAFEGKKANGEFFNIIYRPQEV